MLVKNMNPNIAYKVIIGSSDHTFLPGDIIWLSNKDNSIVSQNGWLEKEEWDNEGTNDFEVEESLEYTVIISEKEEKLEKNINIPFYQYKEAFEELKERIFKAEEELIKLQKTKSSEDDEYKQLSSKLSGLHIAIDYIKELNIN